MTIQKCSSANAEAVGKFYDNVVLYLTKHINYPKWRYQDYPSSASTAEAIRLGEQFMCVLDGNVVGAFILNTNPQGNYDYGDWQETLQPGDFLVIHTLAVHPDCYSQGIGKAMVDYCIRYAVEHGFKGIRLDVVPENLPARKLYERMGFVFAGEKDLERNIAGIPVFALYELLV